MYVICNMDDLSLLFNPEKVREKKGNFYFSIYNAVLMPINLLV